MIDAEHVGDHEAQHPGKGHRSAKRGGEKQLAVFVPLTAQLGWGAQWKRVERPELDRICGCIKRLGKSPAFRF
jgi:hypothetical protein